MKAAKVVTASRDSSPELTVPENGLLITRSSSYISDRSLPTSAYSPPQAPVLTLSDQDLLYGILPPFGTTRAGSGAGLSVYSPARSPDTAVPIFTSPLPTVGGGPTYQTRAASLYSEDDEDFHSHRSEIDAITKFKDLQDAAEEGWGVIMHDELHEEYEPSELECTTIMLKMARAVHNKSLFNDLKWNFNTSHLAMSKNSSVTACLSDELNAVVFFSRADRKVTLAFTESTEPQPISWWDWFWNIPAEVPIDTIKRLTDEVITRSKVKFALPAEKLPQIEIMGFSSGAIVADVAGAILLDKGIECISNTFENPGSLPVITPVTDKRF